MASSTCAWQDGTRRERHPGGHDRKQTAKAAFVVTVQIPANLYGLNQIAIRMESPDSGYSAYNWFYNTMVILKSVDSHPLAVLSHSAQVLLHSCRKMLMEHSILRHAVKFIDEMKSIATRQAGRGINGDRTQSELMMIEIVHLSPCPR
jgi:hypothetical protein